MLLNKDIYHDKISQIEYHLKSDISAEKPVYLISGENGVGKSRFIEGVLLKELKKQNKKLLYFGQDLENQILSYNLIHLVSAFIKTLREQGSFFKTIFLNDDYSHSTDIEFDEKATLAPTETAKRDFITSECLKYNNLDIVIFDEADKYFAHSTDFFELINKTDAKQFIIISHILKEDIPVIHLRKLEKEVMIEQFDH